MNINENSLINNYNILIDDLDNLIQYMIIVF
jgi:hypothetical protein